MSAIKSADNRPNLEPIDTSESPDCTRYSFGAAVIGVRRVAVGGGVAVVRGVRVTVGVPVIDLLNFE